MSHRAILALCLGGLQFVAVLSVVLSTYVTSERALLRQLGDSMNEVSANIISQVQNFLNPAQHTLDATRVLAENGVLDIYDNAELERHFFQQLQLAPQLAGIYFADQSGRFVYVMRSDEAGTYRSKFIPPFSQGSRTHPAEYIWRDGRYSVLETAQDPADTYEARTRPWFTSVTQSRQSVWTDPYIFFTTRDPGITYAVPIIDANGEIRGILGIDIQIDALSDFLANLWPEDRGAAIVLNDRGEVLAHPKLAPVRDDTDMDHPQLARVDQMGDTLAQAAFGSVLHAPPEISAKPVFSNFEQDGERYAATLLGVLDPDVRWLIGIYAHADSFVGEVRKNRTHGVWIALAIAVLTGLMGLALANRISRPLRVYADKTRLVARGEASPEDALQSPYAELDGPSEAFAREIRRRQRFEAAYGRTFDLSSRGMAQLTPETGQFLRVNTQLSEILGYEHEDLEQLTLADLLPDRGDTQVSDAIALLQEDSEYIDEREFLCSDGKPRWLRINALLIRDEKGTPDHILAIFDDIQNQKQNEEITAQLRRDLSHVARVNMMGEMASSLAHELNQPLSAISYNVDAALMTAKRDDRPQDDDLAEILSDISRQSHRAGDIIRALRGLVRKDRGRLAEFELLSLTQQAVTLVEAEARGHHISIDVTCAPDLRVLANRTQIAQVFMNLLKNAVEAISDTGAKSGRISITCSRTADMVLVDIEDNGPGVDPDTNLFQPFDTLKPEGMGLGLSICKTIVEAHGGEIWYDKRHPMGTKICFTLRPAEKPSEST